MHVIVGAGPVGRTLAGLLLERGEQVRVLTRSGSGPAGAECVAVDAGDGERLAALAQGAQALYNCANPQYHRWPQDWPPIAAALRHAAEVSGAVLVTCSNLYVYGPVAGPLTEDLPLAATTVKGRVRARMWEDDLALHEAGRIRVTEARGSDYLGADSRSMFTELVLPKVASGRTAWVPADVDAPHSFTTVLDMARTLAVLATDERAWGHAWHVPTNPPTTLRTAATEYARLAGAPAPRLRRIPLAAVRAAGLFDPLTREFVEMAYQFAAPFVLDSSRAEQTFGLAPTPLAEALAELVPQPA
jgi:nucleoside-diphosphate-sugar epimerase